MSDHKTVRIALVAAALLWITFLSACAALPTTLPSTDTTIQSPPSPVNTPTTAPAAIPSPASSESDLLAFQSRSDLANRLDIDIQLVEMVSDTELEVPTGSLGCGEADGVTNPGMIIGRELVLVADGKEYTYRSDGQRLIPCSPAAFPGGREPTLAAGSAAAGYRAQHMATAALASQLDIPMNSIVLVSNEPVLWPDASLGCPELGMVYAQSITPGYRVVLRAGEGTLEVHTDAADNVVFCQR